jgi:hypothetical protein
MQPLRSLLLGTLSLRAAAAAPYLFAPGENNCTKAAGSTPGDTWWECSRSLRAALYHGNGGEVAVQLDPNFRYQLGDVPLAGRVLDGGGATIRPSPGASCVVYLVGGQGGGVRSSFSRATLSGTVLEEFRTGADAAPALSNAVTVAGRVAVASGSWVFIKTAGAGSAPGPVVTWHATRVLFASSPAAAANSNSSDSHSVTQLFLLDALPASVAANSSVFLSTKQPGRNVGGAGLVRVEGGVLGKRTTAYNRSGEPLLVTSWGRTQQWTLSDLTFHDALCAIQLDTTVLRAYDDTHSPIVYSYHSGVIETGTVSNVVLRGGAVLAAIIDAGGTNGVMFTSVHIWPFSYPGEPNSFCNVLKDTRGYPFYLPENRTFWGGPMTMAAIGGSHAFTGLYMHSAEVGLISAAGMQDTFSDLMGDGLGVMLWFREQTWGSLVRGVNCAYVGVCARLSERASSISFSDVMAPGNDKATHAGLEIGQGSSAYVSKWMALKGNATRIVGAGVVLNTDLGGKVVRSLGLPSVVPPPRPTAGAVDISDAQAEEDYCSAGRSACPAILSCQGDAGCGVKPSGAARSFGSFDDAAQTAAFGCALTQDGVGDINQALTSQPGATAPACHAPMANIANALSPIAGWGSTWSGKYPPWAYNMNTGCPCHSEPPQNDDQPTRRENAAAAGGGGGGVGPVPVKTDDDGGGHNVGHKVAKLQPEQQPQTFCNPLNLGYRFRLEPPSRREAADSTMVLFGQTYFLFASKSGGYWHSPDLLHWTLVEPVGLPLEDYAPTVLVLGGRLFFTSDCFQVYTTDDPAAPASNWSKVADLKEYKDPCLFLDGDKVYMYYGAGPNLGLHAVQLDPANGWKEVGQPFSTIPPQLYHMIGWDNRGDNNTGDSKEPTKPPSIEGSWMSERNGTYYMQFATPGTQYKTYSDAVYTSQSALGPFTPAAENPFSHKPTGFSGGAGHGSTFQALDGQWWHIATSTISVRDRFERRLSLFPLYFTANGTVYADTYFGDYPTTLPATSRGRAERSGPPLGARWSGWHLLSLRKNVSASSCAVPTPDPETGRVPSYNASMAVDEDIRTWWSAASGDAGEWLQLDLGDECQVSAVQINFADEGSNTLGRLGAGSTYQYFVEVAASANSSTTEQGLAWRRLPELDRSDNTLDMPHDYVQLSGNAGFRHIRLTCVRSGAGSLFSVSGLRVFGSCPRPPPAKVKQASVKLARDALDPRRGVVSWAAAANAQFYIVRYRSAADPTGTPSYHNFQVDGGTSLRINALAVGEEYEFTVDAVNENGVASGNEMRG